MTRTAATATLTATNGIATLTLSTGQTFTTSERDGWIKRLDRKTQAAGWARISGYSLQDGALVAEMVTYSA